MCFGLYVVVVELLVMKMWCGVYSVLEVVSSSDRDSSKCSMVMFLEGEWLVIGWYCWVKRKIWMIDGCLRVFIVCLCGCIV